MSKFQQRKIFAFLLNCSVEESNVEVGTHSCGQNTYCNGLLLILLCVVDQSQHSFTNVKISAAKRL